MNQHKNRERTSYRRVPTLVLGAAGFIGRWVAAAAGARGANLLLAVRDRAAAAPIFRRHEVAGEVVEIDLCDAEALRKLVRQARPAVAFNLAGYGVDRTERDEATAYGVNAHLVKTLAETLAETRDPNGPPPCLVHAGSVLEYGRVEGVLSDESPCRPTSVYGKSKLAGTAFLARHGARLGIRAVTARLFTVYGPGEHPGRLLPSLLDTARSGYGLCLTAGNQVRDFTYVEDVAEGLLRLAEVNADAGKVVNLTRGRPMPVRRFVEIARDVLGIAPRLLQFGSIATHWDEAERLEVDTTRLRRLLDWTPPIAPEEGIRRTRDFETACQPAELLKT